MRVAFALLFAALSACLFTGCQTDEAMANNSPLPWNRPAPYGSGLPSTINEGR